MAGILTELSVDSHIHEDEKWSKIKERNQHFKSAYAGSELLEGTKQQGILGEGLGETTSLEGTVDLGHTEEEIEDPVELESELTPLTNNEEFSGWKEWDQERLLGEMSRNWQREG